jgi:hypothetical protein
VRGDALEKASKTVGEVKASKRRAKEGGCRFVGTWRVISSLGTWASISSRLQNGEARRGLRRSYLSLYFLLTIPRISGQETGA